MKRKTSESNVSFFKIHVSIFALFTVCFWLAALVSIASQSMSTTTAGTFLASRFLINFLWGVVVFYHYRIDQQISKQKQDAYQEHFEEVEKMKREHKAIVDLEAEAADGRQIDEEEWRAQHRLQSK